MSQTRIIGSRYRVLATVRRGGMGSVYRAQDEQRNSIVALKEMRADVADVSAEAMLRSLMKEAEVLERLRNPRIPRILEHFSEDGSNYLVMEFIEGISLDRLVREHASLNGTALPHRTVVAYALQICGVLRYLHEDPNRRPIVHRDVKPSNIILREGTTGLVLVDFGLARPIGDTQTTTAAAGTLGYAPTEQLQGQAEPRSDLYALGATMYYMLTAKNPVPMRPCSPRTDCPGIDPVLAEVIEKATRQLPADRYSCAAEMESALLRALRHLDQAKGVVSASAAPLPLRTEWHRPETEVRPSVEQGSTRFRSGVGGDTIRGLARVRELVSHLPEVAGRGAMGKPSLRELAVFSRQLQFLAAAGVNLLRAIMILRDQNTGSALHAPLHTIARALSCGYPVGAAFAAERATFGDMYVALLSAAEKHGALPQVLGQLADYAERDDVLMARVRSALTYPAFVLLVTALLTYLSVTFIVPQFTSILTSMNVRLPLPTKILMLTADILKNPTAMLVCAAAAVVGYFVLRNFLAQRHVRAAVDSALLVLPIAGRLVRRLALARMARCMSTMLRAGLMLDQVIPHAGEVCMNAAYRASLERVRERVLQGLSFGQAIVLDPGMFPPLFSGLVAAGELSGALDGMLERAASLYEEDVSSQLETLITLLEPVLIGLAAVIVGGILISLFLPLVSLLTNML